MAVLKRPRVVAQQRLDLEDWKSLLGSANYDAQQFIKGLISDQPCFISGFVPTLKGSDLTVTRENGCFVLPSDFSVGIDNPLTERKFRLSWYCSGPSDTADLNVFVKENDFVYLTLNYKDTNFVNKSFYNSATGESYTKSSPAEEELELGIITKTVKEEGGNDIFLCKIISDVDIPGGLKIDDSDEERRNNIYDGETIGGEPVNLRTIIKKLLGGVTSPTTKSSGSSLKSIYQQILSCLVAAPETTNSRFEFAANGIFRLEADPLAFLYNKGVLDIAASGIRVSGYSAKGDLDKKISGYTLQDFSNLGLTYNNEKDETETLTVTDATKLKTRLSLEWISKDSSGHIIKVVPITESDIHWTGDEDFSSPIQIPIYGEVGINRGSSWHLHIPVEGVHVSVSQPQVVAKLRLFGNKLNICLQDTTKIIEDGQILYFDIPNPDTSEIGFSYDTEIIIAPAEYKTVDRNDFEINTHKYWLAYREGERIYLRNGTVLYSGHESEIGVDDVSDNFLKNIIGVDDEAQVPDYTDGGTIKGANERGFRGESIINRVGRLTEQVSEIQADASAFFYSNRPMVWKGGQLQVSDHIILSVPQEVQNVIINEKTGKIKERTHNSYILYQRRLLAAVALYKNNKLTQSSQKTRAAVLAEYGVVESSNDRKTNEIKLLVEDDITKAINSWVKIDDGDGIYVKIDRFSNKAIPEIDIDDIIVGDAPANLEETKDYLPLFYHTDKKLAYGSDGDKISHEEYLIKLEHKTATNFTEQTIPALQIPLHKQLISGDNVEFLLGESPKGLSGNQVSFEEEVARQLALTEFRNAAVFVAERDKQNAISEKSIGISYSFWNDDLEN